MSRITNLLSKPLCLSLLAHLLCLLLITLITPNIDFSRINLPDITKRTITLEQLDKNQLTQLKSFGIKDGSKNFSLPALSTTHVASRISKLSLESLKKEIENNNQHTSHEPTKEYTMAELSLIKRMEKKNIPAQTIITEHNLAYSDPEPYRRTSFNIDFIPPEGVSLDELNTTEKMFFSFQKRTYLTYFNSFIKNYEQLNKIRPKLEKAIQTEDHVLTGRVTYDVEGHIVAIKILKWSTNDDIQELFDETLKALKLPNPPASLVHNKEFTIYFQLVFNNPRY